MEPPIKMVQPFPVPLPSKDNTGFNFNRINIFNWARNGIILCEYKPLNIFDSMDMILSEESDNYWDNAIIHTAHKVLKPWVKSNEQSAIHTELLQLDDSVVKDFFQQFDSWEVNWKCTCKQKNRTEQYYSEQKAQSAKCTQW